MSKMYDVAVLGGGPGGYEAAIRGAQLGLSVALIEARELGGTCLNRGCLPTKALLQCAHTYEKACNAERFGVIAKDVTFDYAKIAAHKDKVVKTLTHGVAVMEKAYGVTVVKGFGVLRDEHTIAVGEQTIQAENIVLAVGGAPSRPPIPGIDDKNVLTSDEALNLTEAPDSITIIGGGVIGVEFATLYAALGIPVTILEMMPQILPALDSEMIEMVSSDLKKKGVTIYTGAKVNRIKGGDTVTVEYLMNGETNTVTAASCLVSIGRKPQTEGIGLDVVGITTERGFIPVNDRLQTVVPNIYAIGDITGKIQLAHMAAAQGQVVMANCAGKNRTMRYDIAPTCVYTEPEIAYVGVTEAEAKDRGHSVKCGGFNVATNGKSVVMGAGGYVKLVTDADNGEILGAQMYAPRATDMIAEIAAVMRSEGTIEELADTIHPHPTVSEVIMEAAHDVSGLSCNAMPKRR